MRPRALTLLLLSSAALGLGACGSDVESTSDPAQKPELTAPSSANSLASTTQRQTSTGSTASADSESGVTTQQTPVTPAPATGGATTTVPQTTTPGNTGGGTAAPQGTTGTNGGQTSESFCKQNPGAC